ncbi:hypothetical protein J3F83DRAFT_760629 [Trichoderma novae-zelandiae]
MSDRQLCASKSVLLRSSLRLNNCKAQSTQPRLHSLLSTPRGFTTVKMPSRTVRNIAEMPTIGYLYGTRRLPSDSPTTPFPSAYHRASSAINRRVSLVRTDITTLDADAIVNAAKNSLRGGGGVDGAIHAAAGPGLVRECLARYPDGCGTGDAVITAGHNLAARNVIHTVGPVYESQAVSEPLLRSCYQSCLRTAVENNCATVAFSGISTGVYGYPSDKAAHVACSVVRDFLEQRDPDGKIQRVIFVTFLDKDVHAYNSILP